MPKLWNETIEAHRHAVRDAILDTTAALVHEHGLLAVTMSQIAETTGIGRATLYKYFPDVEAILGTWHERRIAEHLGHLRELRQRSEDPNANLEAVVEAYAFICHHRGQHGADMTALLHRGEPIARAERHLVDLFRDLLVQAAATGQVRDDTSPDELAVYCLHALTAAANLPSKAAVRRLVAVTLNGLRRPA